MLDVVLILVVIGFFGLCALMVRWCGSVIGAGDEGAAAAAADSTDADADADTVLGSAAP